MAWTTCWASLLDLWNLLFSPSKVDHLSHREEKIGSIILNTIVFQIDWRDGKGGRVLLINSLSLSSAL